MKIYENASFSPSPERKTDPGPFQGKMSLLLKGQARHHDNTTTRGVQQ